LSLGGLIKHVTLTERQWTRFIVEGPAAMSWDEASAGDWMSGFRMLDGETVTGLLETYAQVAQQTGELVVQLPDLDAAQPLPAAPWFEPGARWSARRVLLHVIAETAQHAGHASQWDSPHRGSGGHPSRQIRMFTVSAIVPPSINSAIPGGRGFHSRRTRSTPVRIGRVNSPPTVSGLLARKGC
jgi:hypothetical protein